MASRPKQAIASALASYYSAPRDLGREDVYVLALRNLKNCPKNPRRKQDFGDKLRVDYGFVVVDHGWFVVDPPAEPYSIEHFVRRNKPLAGRHVLVAGPDRLEKVLMAAFCTKGPYGQKIKVESLRTLQHPDQEIKVEALEQLFGESVDHKGSKYRDRWVNCDNDAEPVGNHQSVQPDPCVQPMQWVLAFVSQRTPGGPSMLSASRGSYYTWLLSKDEDEVGSTAGAHDADADSKKYTPVVHNTFLCFRPRSATPARREQSLPPDFRLRAVTAVGEDEVGSAVHSLDTDSLEGSLEAEEYKMREMVLQSEASYRTWLYGEDEDCNLGCSNPDEDYEVRNTFLQLRAQATPVRREQSAPPAVTRPTPLD